jgi:transcriptional regulator with XRE-family HTH domain
MTATNTGIIRKATYEGDRALRRTGRRFGDDFRELRLRFGVTQAAVARAIGVSRSVICQLEAGDPDVGPRIRARASAALGATFKMALYADAEPMIRDAAHARLVETLLRLRHPGWHATIEAPVPSTLAGQGRRSTDVRLDGAREIVLFEVESRIQRWEELARECHDKQAAVQATAGPDVRVHAVLVLPPTHRNRAVIRSLAATIQAAFPVPDRVLRDALTNQPGPWPGNGILWLPADGTPADGTPAGGTPAGGTPAGGTPAGGTPAGGTPAGGTPAGGTPAAGGRAGSAEAIEPE